MFSASLKIGFTLLASHQPFSPILMCVVVCLSPVFCLYGPLLWVMSNFGNLWVPGVPTPRDRESVSMVPVRRRWV